MLADRVEQDQIKAILVQSMANILRKCLTYRRNFSIEGLIGITLDESEVFLVNIKETIHNSGYLVSNSLQARTAKAAAINQPSASTPKETIQQLGRRRSRSGSTGVPTTTSQDHSITKTKGKRTAKHITDDHAESSTSAPLKRTRSATAKAELEIKEEPVSAGEEDEGEESDSFNNGLGDSTEGVNEETETYTIVPIRHRPLYHAMARTRKSKPRKSVPLRAVSAISNSQPVFPEQSASDLGQFLSGMKPMLRDIDDVASNMSRDDISNQSADGLKIDTGSNDEDDEGDDGEPLVYIDHCIDGELSDNLNLTSESDMSFGQLGGVRGGRPGSGVGMLILDESDGVMCSICNEIFSDQTTCRRHMKNAHKAKVSYRCELCGKRFWHHGDYTEHKMVFHDGPGGYQCAQCGKMLLSKRGLKEHMQHHTGQFPYYCFKCMRGFGRKFEFTGHMKKHHPGDPIANTPMNVQQIIASPEGSLLEAAASFCDEDLAGPSSPIEAKYIGDEKTLTIETVTEREGLKVIIKKPRRDSAAESSTKSDEVSASKSSEDGKKATDNSSDKSS